MGAERVAVAMSGGVDSSVAAYLLTEQGYDVIGLTMSFGDGKHRSNCCGPDDIEDARRVANHLGVRFYALNYTQPFEAYILNPFVEAYTSGKTPIPCIGCNTFLKFGLLREQALMLGATRIATGHYARVIRQTARLELHTGVDRSKDQSYFLFELTQRQLNETLFPLGNYTKEEVRRIAAQAVLPTAQKPESQEICFVTSGHYSEIVRQRSKEEQGGEFVLTTGEVVGTHNGIAEFTVGQRRRLNLALGSPHYVTAIDPISRRITIGAKRDLENSSFTIERVNWIGVDPMELIDDVTVKIRYKDPGRTGQLVRSDHGRWLVNLQVPATAVTPGQAAVVYRGDRVVGGGWICRPDRAA